MGYMNYSWFDLIYPFGVIFFSSFIALIIISKSLVISVSGASLKASLFFIYFALFFNGCVTCQDDLYYLDVASRLADDRISFLEMMIDSQIVQDMAESAHILYPIHNYISIQLFGNNYFSPIIINILLTIPIAYAGMKLAVSALGISQYVGRMLFIVLLVHPEVLAWSTVFNGKEILLLLLNILLLSGVNRILSGNLLTGLLILVPSIFLVSFVRFYVPALIAAAFILFYIIKKSAYKRPKYLFIVCAIVFAMVLEFDGALDYAIGLIIASFTNPVTGVIRFLLTPIPFLTDDVYAFLDWPALIHWALMPFMIYGVSLVYRAKRDFGIFLIYYVAVFVLFYGSFGELQGPRHRFQLEFAIAVFQCIGVLSFLRRYIKAPTSGGFQKLSANEAN